LNDLTEDLEHLLLHAEAMAAGAAPQGFLGSRLEVQTMTLTHNVACELGQLMEGSTAGALIPEIVCRGLQELLEAEVSALTGAQLHERCPDQRFTHRNGYRRRLLTTQVGDLTLAIPKLRQGSFFPDWLEPRRRVDKALYAVVMEAYTGGSPPAKSMPWWRPWAATAASQNRR
jgi:hypothetical protein